MPYGTDILFIMVLILLNGFFAMSELAIVSARRPRLKAMVERRVPGAAAALALSENPGRFLSIVQVGITVVGIFAGVFGGEQLAPPLEAYFAQFPAVAPAAEAIAITTIIAAITYASIVVGELVPKHLAIRSPERIAVIVAPVMAVLAHVMMPVVFLLETSSRLLLRLLGSVKKQEPSVSDEEIKALVSEGVHAGVFAPQEQNMIAGVMRLADWKVRVIKTPRPNLEWLDLSDDPEQNRRKLMETSFSRLIVTRGGLARPVGIVQSKDLLDQALAGLPLNIEKAMRKPLYVNDGTSALKVLEMLKNSPIHIAVVLDPRGAVNGVVTTFDILKNIVGGFPGATDTAQVVQREDGSWLMDGDLHVHVVRDTLALRQLPADADFHTLAGFMLTRFERVPAAGEHFDWEGLRFEVADMDGPRIDKVLVTRAALPDANSN